MTIVSKQVNMELHKIKQKCPLYESNGSTVSFYFILYIHVCYTELVFSVLPFFDQPH